MLDTIDRAVRDLPDANKTLAALKEQVAQLQDGLNGVCAWVEELASVVRRDDCCQMQYGRWFEVCDVCADDGLWDGRPLKDDITWLYRNHPAAYREFRWRAEYELDGRDLVPFYDVDDVRALLDRICAEIPEDDNADDDQDAD